MESPIDPHEEVEEHYLLLQDAAESAILDTRTMKPTTGQGYKLFSLISLAYLSLSLLSRRVPGPGHWVGLDQHVQLFHRIASMF